MRTTLRRAKVHIRAEHSVTHQHLGGGGRRIESLRTVRATQPDPVLGKKKGAGQSRVSS
jgi:hypothetical protein